jgi:hypothetical protein
VRATAAERRRDSRWQRRRLRRARRGFTLAWYAMIFFVLLGFAALVIDLGLARTTQRIMQTATDSAALESLRGSGDEDVRQFVAAMLDDDLDPENGDPLNIGGGARLEFTGGVDIGGGFYASQKMDVDESSSYIDPEQLQFDPEEERRDGIRNVALAANTPYLFGRGSLLDLKLRANGILTQGESSAQTAPAMSAGRTINLQNRPDMPGALPICIFAKDWNPTAAEEDDEPMPSPFMLEGLRLEIRKSAAAEYEVWTSDSRISDRHVGHVFNEEGDSRVICVAEHKPPVSALAMSFRHNLELAVGDRLMAYVPIVTLVHGNSHRVVGIGCFESIEFEQGVQIQFRVTRPSSNRAIIPNANVSTQFVRDDPTMPSIDQEIIEDAEGFRALQAENLSLYDAGLIVLAPRLLPDYEIQNRKK